MGATAASWQDWRDGVAAALREAGFNENQVARIVGAIRVAVNAHGSAEYQRGRRFGRAMAAQTSLHALGFKAEDLREAILDDA